MSRSLFKDSSLSFQPVVDIASGLVVRYEALSRFDFMNPSDIQYRISSIEEGGLSVELDRRVLWMIHGILQHPDFFHDTQLSVNITGESASNPLFVAWIKSFASSLPNRSHLSLEITETQPITRLDVCQALIDELASMEVSIYLDDVGSGHMTKEIITDLRGYSGIKLDRAVVQRWGKDDDSVLFTRSIINAASERNASITAEFIDSGEKLVQAHEFGIHSVQGFALGRPTPYPEKKDRIRKRWDEMMSEAQKSK